MREDVATLVLTINHRALTARAHLTAETSVASLFHYTVEVVFLRILTTDVVDFCLVVNRDETRSALRQETTRLTGTGLRFWFVREC